MGTLTKPWNDGSGDVLTVQYSGTGDGTVAVSSDPNAGTAAREITLTIAAASGPSRTVTVRQLAANTYKPLTFDILTAGTVTWENKYLREGTSQSFTVEYRKNGGAWTSITAVDTTGVTLQVAVGDVLQWRGSNTAYGNSDWNFGFGGTAQFNVSGNLDSLIGGNPMTANYAFQDFFQDSSVVSAGNLILPTGTTTKCYQFMFRRCSLLTTAPASLPATTLADYCYHSMFYECTSLTSAPTLPATTLGVECYRAMFCYCTSLTSAPTLPATTMVTGCYYSMFYGCTALTTAPTLPATTLVKDCYKQMFYNCSSLNYIKVYCKTKPSTTYSQNWLNGVAASGSFYKLPQASSWSASRSASCVPSGWSIYAMSS